MWSDAIAATLAWFWSAGVLLLNSSSLFTRSYSICHFGLNHLKFFGSSSNDPQLLELRLRSPCLYQLFSISYDSKRHAVTTRSSWTKAWRVDPLYDYHTSYERCVFPKWKKLANLVTSKPSSLKFNLLSHDGCGKWKKSTLTEFHR